MTGIDCGVQFEMIERILDKKMGGLGSLFMAPLLNYITPLLTLVSSSVIENAGPALASCLILTFHSFKGNQEYAFLRTFQA